MILTIIIVVVVLIVAILAYAATKPDVFRVERAATIKAPAATIFPLISDLAAWGAWSPWAKKDPAMKMSFSSATSGTGAVFEWDGNKNVGKGRMEITDSAPPAKVTIKLDFIKPFEGHNVAEFSLAPDGDATRVTWAMQGPTPFLGKIVSVFINCDKMVGRDFEAGLANLKAVSEK
jgi:hypothetical protein